MKNPHPIIVIEDNPDDQALLKLAFSECGVKNELRMFRTPAEALACLHDAAPGGATGLRPALLLLDFNLPGLRGDEVLHRLRAHPATRFLPVLMLTSSALERDLQLAYEAGANGYVQKPVNFEEFVDAIASIVNFWLVRNLSVDASQAG